MRKHKDSGKATPAESLDLEAENRRLRAELAEVKRANEILKRASAYTLRRSSTAHREEGHLPLAGESSPSSTIIDKGTQLEFYLIPLGELVATLDLPLTELRNINIERHGQFIAGDDMRLPLGVEDRRKSTPVSDNSVPRLSDK